MAEHLEGVFRLPAPALRRWVVRYAGYRTAGDEPGVHRGLPSPHLTMVLTIDEPLEVRQHPDPRQPGGSFDALVAGLHTRPALITHDGWQSGVQLSLTPWGARALLGRPAAELAGVDVPATDVLGRRASEQLLAAVRDHRSWPERFAALDSELGLMAQASAVVADRRVVAAWQVLLRSHGRCSVADLAEGLGWSTRQLLHRFTAETGLSPKKAARLMRFDLARRSLLRSATAQTGRSRLRIADVAASHGYADQSHLDRDFADLAGCSPTAWLAEELRNVQVPAPGRDGG